MSRGINLDNDDNANLVLTAHEDVHIVEKVVLIFNVFALDSYGGTFSAVRMDDRTLALLHNI